MDGPSGTSASPDSGSSPLELTAPAQRALQEAEATARRLHQDRLLPDHLLLGLLSLTSGVAFDILSDLDVEPPALRQALEEKMEPGALAWMEEPQDISWSPQALSVLERAVEEMRRWGHPELGTEHLLLALLIDPAGTALRVFGERGVTRDAVEKQVLKRKGVGTLVEAVVSTAPSFDPRMEQVIERARAEARRLQETQISLNTLWLTLLSDVEAAGTQILTFLGIEPSQIRTELALYVPRRFLLMGEIPFSPLAQRALDFAAEEASGLKDDYIGTEHLLLGLWRAEAMVQERPPLVLGLPAEAVRQKVKAFPRGPAHREEGL